MILTTIVTNPMSHFTLLFIYSTTPFYASRTPQASITGQMSPFGSTGKFVNTTLILQGSVVIRLHLATDISDYTVFVNQTTTQFNTKVCSRYSVFHKS